MEEDVAADVIRRLERLGIDYYITGSEALPRYGEPRQTADIDLVLAMAPDEFHRVRSAFEGESRSAFGHRQAWEHPRLAAHQRVVPRLGVPGALRTCPRCR